MQTIASGESRHLQCEIEYLTGLTETGLSDAYGRGITVTELAAMDEPVDAAMHTVVAFVGRALRGPLDQPVLITSFTGFCRRFGGIWSRSSLGPAVQQFFEHGGKRLYVVRVANNACGARLSLPAEQGVLVLAAVEPGSTEQVRVSIDYDRIADDDREHFNLTAQRVSPGTLLVTDQEIHERLSLSPSSRRYVADVLLDSAIVRVQLPLPAGRPLATIGPAVASRGGYVSAARRGSDGEALSDYDLVGSAADGTGMFALNSLESLDLLYLPAPARQRDLGPAAMLAAELYCRKRGAMLILDPPASWKTVDDALAGTRASALGSANALSYFPRAFIRGDAARVPRTIGGAIAGLLCRLDERIGPWQDLDQPGYGFKLGVRPALEVSAVEGARLVREGLNVIAGISAGRASLCGGVTLARGTRADRKSVRLPVRRLSLYICNSVGRATRWAVFQHGGQQVAHRLRAQVHAFMAGLAERGAFENGRFEVQCDAGRRSAAQDPHHGVTIVLSFLPVESDEFIWLTLHQTVQGCRVAETVFAPAPAACA